MLPAARCSAIAQKRPHARMTSTILGVQVPDASVPFLLNTCEQWTGGNGWQHRMLIDITSCPTVSDHAGERLGGSYEALVPETGGSRHYAAQADPWEYVRRLHAACSMSKLCYRVHHARLGARQL